MVQPWRGGGSRLHIASAGATSPSTVVSEAEGVQQGGPRNEKLKKLVKSLHAVLTADPGALLLQLQPQSCGCGTREGVGTDGH